MYLELLPGSKNLQASPYVHSKKIVVSDFRYFVSKIIFSDFLTDPPMLTEIAWISYRVSVVEYKGKSDGKSKKSSFSALRWS